MTGSIQKHSKQITVIADSDNGVTSAPVCTVFFATSGLEGSVLMQRLSYPTETALSKKITRDH